MKPKAFTRRRLLNLCACLLLIAAVALVVLTLLMHTPSVQKWYDQFQLTLVEFEQAVASIPYRWLIPIVIELLFLAKAWIPVIPLSAISVISGMVFSVPVAFVLNAGGIVLLMSARYLVGLHIGPSNIQKVLRRYPTVREILEEKGSFSPVLLFVFRLVPSFPINTISQLYGSMDYVYWKYILISLAGFAPKLLSYTFIGRNVYDPLSWSFILPIVILLVLSGLSVLLLNAFLDFIEQRRGRAEKSEQAQPKARN
ncbi:MAG TPA: TVP38/TMEM64 family protein [Candidatus Fimivicinus intestinavium]|nr:TVP38/TMEM64 family protein [Candidatus Fimivicinus intestinavium]